MTNLNNQQNTNVSILSNFRRFFLTGLLVTAPIIITIYVTWLVITFIDIKVANLLPEYLDFRKALPFQIPGLGLVIVIFVVTLIGAITPGLIGRNLLKLGEMILFKTPVIRTVYSSIKQIMETVMSTNSKSFKDTIENMLDNSYVRDEANFYLEPNLNNFKWSERVPKWFNN